MTADDVTFDTVEILSVVVVVVVVVVAAAVVVAAVVVAAAVVAAVVESKENYLNNLKLSVRYSFVLAAAAVY